MKYRSIAILTAITSLISIYSLDAEESKELRLYNDMSRAVVRLEHVDIITRKGQKDTLEIVKSDGTGFIVLFDNKGYLVSARHITQQDYDLRARVTVRHSVDKDTLFEVVELQIPKNAWVFHSNEGNDSVRYVDVATTKLNPPPWKDRSPLVIQESLFASKDPEPLDPIYVVGYPLELGIQLHRQRPFVRAGIISMKAEQMWLKLGKKFVHEQMRILDVPVLPGNSGSPIFRKPEMGRKGAERFELFGLVLGYTGKFYSFCEPMSHIKQTLEKAKNTEPMASWHLLP